MNQNDRAILCVLVESGLDLTPDVLHKNVNRDMSKRTIFRRLNGMQDRGYIEKTGEGYYGVTDYGIVRLNQEAPSAVEVFNE